MSAARSLPVVQLRPVSFTGSEVGRVALCPASAVLPHRDSENDASRDGVHLHAYLACVTLSPASKSEALRALPAHLRDRAAAIDVAAILDGYEVIGVEMHYAYNVDTGEARSLGMHRDRRDAYKGLRSRELGCTLDLVGRRRGVPSSRDWKTGRTDYGAAEEAWQLKIGGLVQRALTGSPIVHVAFDYIEQDGGHHCTEATFEPWDLDVAAEELRGIVDSVEQLEGVLGAHLDTFEGGHCGWCPAFDACPSKHRLARVVADAAAIASMPSDEDIRALAPRDKGQLWSRVRAFIEVAERVEGVLREDAQRARFPLPNGKVLGGIQVKGRLSFDKEAAIAALRVLGATDEQIASLERRGAPHVQVRELNK